MTRAEEVRTKFDNYQELYSVVEDVLNDYDSPDDYDFTDESDDDSEPIHEFANKVLTRLTDTIRDCVDEYYELTGIALT